MQNPVILEACVITTNMRLLKVSLPRSSNLSYGFYDNIIDGIVK